MHHHTRDCLRIQFIRIASMRFTTLYTHVHIRLLKNTYNNITYTPFRSTVRLHSDRLLLFTLSLFMRLQKRHTHTHTNSSATILKTTLFFYIVPEHNIVLYYQKCMEEAPLVCMVPPQCYSITVECSSVTVTSIYTITLA